MLYIILYYISVMQNHSNNSNCILLTISSGAKIPNWTFLTLRKGALDSIVAMFL